MKRNINKKTVCIIGHFGFAKNLLNGQTVKTKIITKELEKQLGKEEVLKIDTHGGKKKMLQLIFQLPVTMKNVKNIIMMPAHNGIRFFAPLLVFFNSFFHIKLHYVVIGGWLPEFLENKKRLQKNLKKFDGIYVETNTMKVNMEKLGFSNIYILPNCKELKILKENELDINSVVNYYLTTAADGKPYRVKFYSLEMIMAVGFRVRSIRGVQFRQWANRNLTEYLRKGFIIDDERLKNPDGRPDYFDELLARIRDIRASEKRFYQKVRDLFALSSDYDKTDKATQMFYAETQNKLLYAVTGRTSAEIVTTRADANAPNMGLTSWKGTVVRKQDVIIAKNYLTQDELDSLNRLVVIFLETAEFRAKNRKDLTMNFWRENIDKILLSNDQRLLPNAGTVSKVQKDEFAYQVYEEFNARRKRKEAIEADREDMEQLRELEAEIKHRTR